MLDLVGNPEDRFSHNETQINELADQQAKAGAHEMVEAHDHGQIAMDKREAIAEIKQKIGEKWKLKFLLSEKMERIQETFFEVEKGDCYEEYDRASFSAINQILCGHSRLNGHHKTEGRSCVQSVKCQKLLSTSSFDCDIYSDERKELESVENI